MHLASLHLENFRNYERLDYDFSASKSAGSTTIQCATTTILTGENAQGKSNFLEAIYTLALTKSFRSSKHEQMTQWGKDFFRVRAELMDGTTLEQCLVSSPKKQKAFKKNDVIIPRNKFIGHLRVVLFRPEDLNMLILEPSLRRQYLNNIIIQTEPEALESFQKYQHALMQRNALLQQRAGKEAFQPWNEKLAEEGEKIRLARQKLIDFLGEHLTEPYTVKYQTYAGPLQEGFERNLERDLRTGFTSVGPHRDDLVVLYEGHPIANAASRGEMRRLMMKLKKAEIDWLGGDPIVLLDDIFSELDSSGKEEILKLIPNTQTIITVAEGNPLPALSGEATVRKLSQGRIEA